jgi:hypothetical protein
VLAASSNFSPTKLESKGQASTRCVKFHAVTLWDVYFRIRFPKRNIGGRVCLSLKVASRDDE